jgi:hypothetical protein
MDIDAANIALHPARSEFGQAYIAARKFRTTHTMLRGAKDVTVDQEFSSCHHFVSRLTPSE